MTDDNSARPVELPHDVGLAFKELEQFVLGHPWVEKQG